MNLLAVENLKVNSQTTLNFGKMKIRKENFDKLKQLDRIEFRQRKDIIDRKFKVSYGRVMIMILLGISITLLSMLVIVGAYNNGEVDTAKNLFEVMSLALRIFLIIMYLDIIWQIIKIMIGYILSIKLEQEYFTEEIKVKK